MDHLSIASVWVRSQMNAPSDLQKRRAVNQIWNAAQDYTFIPDFKAFQEDGTADLYWNSIIGAVRKHYDYNKLCKLFSVFSQYEDGDLYLNLLWLGLENCVFQREVTERPVLQDLRFRFAQEYVRRYADDADEESRLFDYLALAHYQRIIGLDPVLNTYDRKLLDELEFGPELSTDDIVALSHDLFLRWFQIHAEELRKQHTLPLLHLPGRYRKKKTADIKKFGLGFAERRDYNSGDDPGNEGDRQQLRTDLSAEELRAFMASKYGRSLFSDQKCMELERELCRGNHAWCHLHFTRGDPETGKIQNAFEALHKQQEEAQVEKNRQYYRSHQAQNTIAINQLTGRIQNSVLLYLQPSPVKASSGQLDGRFAWRAAVLGDVRVFTKNDQDNMGDLCVDILLDASTSQIRRQETVSSQGYIIAEALTRCSIPCRVMSFCSMTGYTILRIFRDYNERGNNRKIFEYVSNGCNRDGLAVRCAHHLISQAPYEHKMLIILSDVKPNDIVKIPSSDDSAAWYEKDAGIRDTALEVRRARADGIAVICVFTGEDADLPSVKTVYGQDFTRIPSPDKLANAVGQLIQNQIRSL